LRLPAEKSAHSTIERARGFRRSAPRDATAAIDAGLQVGRLIVAYSLVPIIFPDQGTNGLELLFARAIVDDPVELGACEAKRL